MASYHDGSVTTRGREHNKSKDRNKSKDHNKSKGKSTGATGNRDNDACRQITLLGVYFATDAHNSKEIIHWARTVEAHFRC